MKIRKIKNEDGQKFYEFTCQSCDKTTRVPKMMMDEIMKGEFILPEEEEEKKKQRKKLSKHFSSDDS